MKKIAMISFVVAILGLVPAAMAQLPPTGGCVELITDGGDALTATDIGEVCVSNDGSVLTVTYSTIGGPWWSLLTTHLHVWGPDDDPPKLVGGGNPVPGQFAWQVPDEETATSATFYIPLAGNYPGKGKKVGDAYDWTDGPILNIAAHSVVGNGLCDCELLLGALPTTVTPTVVYPGSATDSYFTVTIPEESILGETLTGWCADADTDITLDEPLPLTAVYSSICDDVEDIPTDNVQIPDNLDLVNWVLNNKGDYTAGTIQYAIWVLLSGAPRANLISIISPPFTTGEGYDLEDALQLIADAEAYGEGFWPACGEIMGVILIPPPISLDPLVLSQALLVEIPAPCCETAWGGTAVTLGDLPDDSDENGWGLDFPGRDWAMYFTYQVALPDLIVSDITLDSATITDGDYLTFEYTVANIGGEGQTGNSVFDVAGYLSTDAVLDASDTMILGPGGSSGTYSAWTYHLAVGWSHSLYVDDGEITAGPGSYFLIMDADTTPGQPPNFYPGVVESNEDNNTMAVPFTVVAPTPP